MSLLQKLMKIKEYLIVNLSTERQTEIMIFYYSSVIQKDWIIKGE